MKNSIQRLLVGACVLAASVQATAQGPSAGRTANVVGRADTRAILPGTPAASFSTVQGSALDSVSRLLPDALVRLRDARFGRIAGSQRTDRAGLFAFHSVDPGSYVVELVGNNQGVLGASPLFTATAGEVVTTVVKIPFRDPLGGVLGPTVGHALAITSAAAAAGVVTVIIAGRDVSPE